VTDERRIDDGEDLPEQLRIRREKRDELIAAGQDPYPVTVERTHSLRDIVNAGIDLLRRRIADPSLEPTVLKLACPLVVRGSTANIPASAASGR